MSLRAFASPWLGQCASVAMMLVLLAANHAAAQADLTGLWRPLPRNEDGSGMIGDAAGLPITSSARWRADSWSPEDFDVTEWACRPHAWHYSLETVLTQMRIWTDIDRETQQIVAYHGHVNLEMQQTSILMHTTPHPAANSRHTWSGFSTGAWD